MSETLSCKSNKLSLEIDAESGKWNHLLGGNSERSWISSVDGCLTGQPFLMGTALDQGKAIPLRYRQVDPERLEGRSIRGEIHSSLSIDEETLRCSLSLPDRRGPRSGWHLDLDHLDHPGGEIRQQLMPVTIETAEDLSWAYLLWHRSDDDYLLVTVPRLSAGWRINYSYAGHRMLGFQLLARADDVICDVGRFSSGRLPSVTRLEVNFSFVSSRQEGLAKAAELLGLAIIKPSSNGVPAGNSLSFQSYGSFKELAHTSPSGDITRYSEVPDALQLNEPGIHLLESTSPDSRQHVSRILCLDQWNELADRALSFHREHYQLPVGAFARIIHRSSLQPDGVTMEGKSFGDPEQNMSCRTGEFGGFAAWAQIRHMRKFGSDEAMRQSVQKYFDWMLNKGREDDPLPGTLCFRPSSYKGREFSAYHFFEEFNYAQHEAWLIEQMTEAIAIGYEDLLPHLEKMCRHYIDDHVDENGVIWNQNLADEVPVDYCTVDAPVVHLIAAARLLNERHIPLGDQILELARKTMQHLLARGLSFPTEGEACTEDGSIACQAWALAHGYNELSDPDPAWLKLSEELMQFHSKLEMSGCSVQSNGSSVRFWETQYESDSYGPSINASHGWTLWSAYARWELYRATGAYEHLRKVWEHTTCVAHRIDERGGMSPCFTPDVIPDIPHDDGWGDPALRYEGRLSSSSLGLGYPDVYSMSGMFLFILAPEVWYQTCGVSFEEKLPLNALLQGDVLQPHTPLPCNRIAIDGRPDQPITVEGLATTGEICLSCSRDVSGLKIEGVEGWTETSPGVLKFSAPSDGRIRLS